MKKSFTLIELLIVLVIIGIVAVLAVPKYELYVRKSRGAEAKTILRALSDACWEYYLEAGTFPESTPEHTLPANLDATLANRTTKYFYYAYFNNSNQYCEFTAIDIDVYTAGGRFDTLPVGAVIMYTLSIMRADIVNKDDPAAIIQKIDDNWYRVYKCLIKVRADWYEEQSW